MSEEHLIPDPDKECMLTTIDNPYNPFTNFEEWFLYDVEQGYNTCSYLGRITNTTNDMSTEEEQIVIENAMNDIIAYNPLGIYCKIYRDTDIKTLQD